MVREVKSTRSPTLRLIDDVVRDRQERGLHLETIPLPLLDSSVENSSTVRPEAQTSDKSWGRSD